MVAMHMAPIHLHTQLCRCGVAAQGSLAEVLPKMCMVFGKGSIYTLFMFGHHNYA